MGNAAMAKRMVIMLVIVGLLLGGIFWFEAYKATAIRKFMAKESNPAQFVSTMVAVKKPWRARLEAIGTLKGHNSTDISPQIAGLVTSIDFTSGERVKKGQLLVTLEAREDKARLASLVAAENIAQITYQRAKKEYHADAISKQTLDTDLANLKEARANVAQQQAAVEYKSVQAPFSGRLGIRKVDLGQYLNPGTTIVTLQSLNPIYVDFTLPQQYVRDLTVGKIVTVHCDSYPDQVFKGEISAISSAISTSTRNVEVRAVLNNPGDRLLTGMYAKVAVAIGPVKRYITVPQTAIAYNPYGDTVYLVEKKTGLASGKTGKLTSSLFAKQQFVEIGKTRGDQVQILKGVKAGDVVVTAGQIKLHSGSPVKINNSVQPSNEANPTPDEQM